MTITSVLISASKFLNAKNIDSPHLDAEVLLAYTIKKPKEWLFSHSESILSSAQIKKFDSAMKRRGRHEPVAYITGMKEFYGNNFFINKHTLIPRPATEILVQETQNLLLNPIAKTCVIDVGTGSGCVAITLAKILKDVTVFAIDSSKTALACAKKNARIHEVKKIKFLHGSLLKSLISYSYRTVKVGPAQNVVVVANLPYLTNDEWKQLPRDIKKYEPKGALIGGKDGLAYYRGLLKQLASSMEQKTKTIKQDKNQRTQKQRGRETKKRMNTICLFEINSWQKKPLTAIIKKFSPHANIEWIKDLDGSIRVCKISIFKKAD